MDIRHLTPKDYKVSNWSGGTTTEILIWPENANYAAREFSLRISSATVDVEESDFTALPGVLRYIVPLEGGFTLTHPHGSPVVLVPLDAPYRFSGEIPTHCVGKATDFNLMLKGVDGVMAVCRDRFEIHPGLNCIYAPQGGRVSIAGERKQLAVGDSLVIFADQVTEVTVEKTMLHCFASL